MLILMSTYLHLRPQDLEDMLDLPGGPAVVSTSSSMTPSADQQDAGNGSD